MIEAKYNWICQPVEYSYSPAQMKVSVLDNSCYWYVTHLILWLTLLPCFHRHLDSKWDHNSNSKYRKSSNYSAKKIIQNRAWRSD